MSKKTNKKKNNLKEEKIMDEKNEEVVEPVEEIIEDGGDKIEEVVEPVEEIIEPKIIIEDGIENNEIIGKIINFDKLYVRKEANKDSEPVGIVSKEDDLSIDKVHSTDEFYKVVTSNGLEGYCLKEFVKIE